MASSASTDELDEALKMDPLDFRLKNAATQGTKAAHGPVFRASASSRRSRRRRSTAHYTTPLPKSKKGMLYGRGVASGFGSIAGGESSAQVNINEDGTVVVITGHPDIGGSRASTANITAEILGIDYKKVSVLIGDTSVIGFSNLTGGSRVTYASAMVGRSRRSG